MRKCLKVRRVSYPENLKLWSVVLWKTTLIHPIRSNWYNKTKTVRRKESGRLKLLVNELRAGIGTHVRSIQKSQEPQLMRFEWMEHKWHWRISRVCAGFHGQKADFSELFTSPLPFFPFVNIFIKRSKLWCIEWRIGMNWGAEPVPLVLIVDWLTGNWQGQ